MTKIDYYGKEIKATGYPDNRGAKPMTKKELRQMNSSVAHFMPIVPSSSAMPYAMHRNVLAISPISNITFESIQIQCEYCLRHNNSKYELCQSCFAPLDHE